MMQKRAFVLLSGGIDSSTCLYQAVQDYPAVTAVSIDYGQRHRREIEAAAVIADYLNVGHQVLKLDEIMADVMLTDPNVALPNVSYAELGHGVSPTYVPFRNGTLLSLITATAQKYVNTKVDKHIDQLRVEISRGDVWARDVVAHATNAARDLCGVYFGAHAEDAHNWAYPDCTPEFIGAMANAIYIGTYMTVRLHTPLQWMNKADIIRKGASLGVPFQFTRSCYSEDKLHCGTCPTCRARREGFKAAGIGDPTLYQVDDGSDRAA